MSAGKDENHGNAGGRGRRRGNIKVKGNMRKNGINNYGIWGGNMYIIYIIMYRGWGYCRGRDD